MWDIRSVSDFMRRFWFLFFVVPLVVLVLLIYFTQTYLIIGAWFGDWLCEREKTIPCDFGISVFYDAALVDQRGVTVDENIRNANVILLGITPDRVLVVKGQKLISRFRLSSETKFSIGILTSIDQLTYFEQRLGVLIDQGYVEKIEASRGVSISRLKNKYLLTSSSLQKELFYSVVKYGDLLKIRYDARANSVLSITLGGKR